MVVIYNNRGTGCGSGPIDYLLGKNRDRENANLLRGDPETTLKLIDSLDFKKKYTSGLLSFSEKNLTEETKNKIMDEFERTTFCGLDHNQYDITWIQHLDKDNLELNFVIPNVELSTGKRFQPYYDKIDRSRINAFRDVTNMEYGFTDPLNPSKKQVFGMAKDLPKDKKKAVEVIQEALTHDLKLGRIKNREDVIKSLENRGFEIARITPQALSIKDPDGVRNIRLKGEMYEQSFRYDNEYRERNEERTADFERGSENSLQSAQARLEAFIGKRAERYKSTYAKPSTPIKQDIKKEFENNRVVMGNKFCVVGFDSFSLSRNFSIPRFENKEESRTNSDVGQNHTGIRGMGYSNIRDRGWQIPFTSQKNKNRSRLERYKRTQSFNKNRGIKIDRIRKSFIDSIKTVGDKFRIAIEQTTNSIGKFTEKLRASRIVISGNQQAVRDNQIRLQQHHEKIRSCCSRLPNDKTREFGFEKSISQINQSVIAINNQRLEEQRRANNRYKSRNSGGWSR